MTEGARIVILSSVRISTSHPPSLLRDLQEATRKRCDPPVNHKELMDKLPKQEVDNVPAEKTRFVYIGQNHFIGLLYFSNSGPMGRIVQ